MSDQSLKLRIDRAIDRALSEKRIVGAIVLVARDGEVVAARGRHGRSRGRTADGAECDLPAASLTKPLVFATALAMIDRGVLGLDDFVTDTWLTSSPG